MGRMCIHQTARPSKDTAIGMNENGRGNCFICTPDEKNDQCSCFKPVWMCEMEVLEAPGGPLHPGKVSKWTDYGI